MNRAGVSGARARAIAFAALLVDRYRSYHDHKETMAYGGTTLFIAGVVATITADKWPPQWLASSKCLLTAFITGVWLIVLVFVKWQLRRRRWAAMRLAGVERLLARWVSAVPLSDDDLQTFTPSKVQAKTRLSRALSWLKHAAMVLLDHIWPLNAVRQAVDLGEAVYPKAFVDMWELQWKEKGTEALFHEGLLVLTGWAAYAVLLIGSLAGTP